MFLAQIHLWANFNGGDSYMAGAALSSMVRIYSPWSRGHVLVI